MYKLIRQIAFFLIGTAGSLPSTFGATYQRGPGFEYQVDESAITILFVNGVRNDVPEVEDSTDRLIQALEAAGLRQRTYNFEHFYNPTDGLVGSGDILEAIEQARVSDAMLTLAGGDKRKYYNLLGTYYATQASAVPASLSDVQRRIATTVARLALTMKSMLATSAGLVVIPHSQGNLYVEAAYATLVASNDSKIGSIRVVGVAAASATTPSDRYITHTHDDVIALLRLGALPTFFPLSGNETACVLAADGSLNCGNNVPWNTIDSLRHGFQEVYLNPSLKSLRSGNSFQKIVYEFVTASLKELEGIPPQIGIPTYRIVDVCSLIGITDAVSTGCAALSLTDSGKALVNYLDTLANTNISMTVDLRTGQATSTFLDQYGYARALNNLGQYHYRRNLLPRTDWVVSLNGGVLEIPWPRSPLLGGPVFLTDAGRVVLRTIVGNNDNYSLVGPVLGDSIPITVPDARRGLTFPYAANASDAVVGYGGKPIIISGGDPGAVMWPFQWDPTTGFRLLDVPSNFVNMAENLFNDVGYARSINKRGDVAGVLFYTHSTGNERYCELPYIWPKGQQGKFLMSSSCPIVPISNSIGEFIGAIAIGDSGIVVGMRRTSGFSEPAGTSMFVWNESVGAKNILDYVRNSDPLLATLRSCFEGTGSTIGCNYDPSFLSINSNNWVNFGRYVLVPQ